MHYDFIVKVPLTTGETSFTLSLETNVPINRMIIEHIVNGMHYEPDVAALVLAALRPGDTFVDVGANIGYFTCLAAALAGPGGRVVSIEPSPANLPHLRHNLAVNGFGNVTLVPVAVSNQPGEVDFWINDRDGGGSALWDPKAFPGNAPNQARHVRLRATTLDDLAVEHGFSAGVRIIKIDTEGAEALILSGAASLLDPARTPFVICELHWMGLGQLGHSAESLRALMLAAGYHTFLLLPDGGLPKLLPPHTTLRSATIPNILFSTIDAVGAVWPHEDIDLRKFRKPGTKRVAF
ncbi:MAG: FkbM family methyltransferase [Alphaproteobacteria bacterium]|nr:FkbM family methyltransferase [Alphaproteobacteria bacterium]MBF0332505.1 FkbM family methyltransferase [Alphaproteobacteria bacterium]